MRAELKAYVAAAGVALALEQAHNIPTHHSEEIMIDEIFFLYHSRKWLSVLSDERLLRSTGSDMNRNRSVCVGTDLLRVKCSSGGTSSRSSHYVTLHRQSADRPLAETQRHVAET